MTYGMVKTSKIGKSAATLLLKKLILKRGMREFSKEEGSETTMSGQ